jgi:hypothetical protein
MSTPAPQAPAPPAAPAQQEPLPSAVALLTAAKLAIKKDKPIMLDYFVDSLTGKAFLGEDTETKERMLVKSKQEFTSLIDKVYKAGPPTDEYYIIETENSIYIASGKIARKRIQASSLLHDEA